MSKKEVLIHDLHVNTAMYSKKTLFPSYFNILEGEQSARYLDCKHRPVSFTRDEPTEVLWEKHRQALSSTHVQDNLPTSSLLDLKIELASRIFHSCCFCERRCGINREKESGHCGVQEARIASEFLHLGEESLLVPSHTIFFSGCPFHCVFCQNWDISQQSCGLYIEPKKLVDIIEKRHAQGAKNVNWVGGDPTPNLHFILSTLQSLEVNTPQVWNSNMYCSQETMTLLDGVIDVYLTDFKYGNDGCAKRLSEVSNYWKITTRNHTLAYHQTEVLIRHLVMPNHSTCCSKPLLSWIASRLPHAGVNIMAQYRPEYNAHGYEEISSCPTSEEIQEVRDYAKSLELHTI